LFGSPTFFWSYDTFMTVSRLVLGSSIRVLVFRQISLIFCMAWVPAWQAQACYSHHGQPRGSGKPTPLHHPEIVRCAGLGWKLGSATDPKWAFYVLKHSIGMIPRCCPDFRQAPAS
jgi:hypothetical protein